jgi:prepilin-type N-terminal cleavage/methylation domain-containing protein
MQPTSTAPKPTPSSGGRRRGHTLTELLVVLAILTLLAFIVGPRLLGARNRVRLDEAVQLVLNDLSFAKARAISTGLRHQVEVNTQTGELIVLPYHPEEATTGAVSVNQAEPDVALREQMPEDIEITSWEVSPMGLNTGTTGSSAQAGFGPLTFYPEGRGDNASLVLRNPDGDRKGVLVDGYSGTIREMTEDELARYR